LAGFQVTAEADRRRDLPKTSTKSDCGLERQYGGRVDSIGGLPVVNPRGDGGDENAIDRGEAPRPTGAIAELGRTWQVYARECARGRKALAAFGMKEAL